MHQYTIAVIGTKSAGKHTLVRYFDKLQYDPLWTLSVCKHLREAYEPELVFQSNTDTFVFKLRILDVEVEELENVDEIDGIIYVYDSSDKSSIDAMKVDVALMNEKDWAFVAIGAKADFAVAPAAFISRELRAEEVEMEGSLFHLSAKTGSEFNPVFESLVYQFEDKFSYLKKVVFVDDQSEYDDEEE
jgi:GTPase Era involved in 16S rRNA processing